MNDPQVTVAMYPIRQWLEMPLTQAKQAMKLHMENEGGFSAFDFELLESSESVEEAIGAVFGL